MAKNGYDQTYEDDRKENEETANLIPKAYNKVKEMGGKAWDYAKTHSLKDVYDSMDQRSIADVVKGKAPIYKDVEKKAKGGKVKSSASKRADGCCVKGKTKGKML
jgi:hypothetical protein